MKSRYKSRYLSSAIALVFAAAAPAVASAQLTGAVTVEGDYLPDIIRHDRINMLPAIVRYQTDRTPMPYALDGISADFTPSRLALPATAWRGSLPPYNHRGYLDLSLGSWLNANLSAGVDILSGEKQRLAVWLQHNSTSLWKPYSAYGIDATRYSYQESLGVDYMRRFGNAGTLSAAVQYRLGLFNYYAYMPLAGDKMPTQTLNDAAFRLAWHSDMMTARGSRYHAGVRGRYFGYREGQREFDLGLEGGYAFVWDENTSLGIDAEADILFNSASDDYTALADYGLVRLTPFYQLTRRQMRLRLGVDLDIAANADGSKPDTHYSAFHVAPDVRFDIRGRSVGFYAYATGGSRLHTLALASQWDNYCAPSLLSTQPVYTPVDARLGLEFGPFAGFSAGLEGRFKYSMHIPTEGWYGDMLNDPLLPQQDMSGLNLAGVSVGLNLRYNLGEVFSISAAGSFQPQSEKHGYFNGLDRPKWTVEAEALCRPVKPLQLGVKYTLRADRNITQRVKHQTSGNVIINGGTEYINELTALKNISTLDFSAAWHFNDKFALTLRGANLLNRHEELLPSLISEGVTVYGGISLLF